jgi:GNAT acetyltransferase-like protein
MKNTYIIDSIESIDDFRNLKESWEKLNKANSNSTLFSSFQIFEYYYQIIQTSFPQTSIKIFVVKNKSQEIIAIFPFTYEKQTIVGRLQLNKLSIKDNILGWYSLLVDPNENIHQILTEFIGYLNSIKNTWDLITIHHIQEQDVSYKDLRVLCKNHFKLTINETKTLVVDCHADFDNLLQHMKGKKRREMKRKIKRLTEKGSMELISLRNSEDIQKQLPHFFQIEDNNWKGKQGTSILKSSYKTYFENVAFKLAEENRFRLYFLKINKAYASGIYAIVDSGTLYFVKIGYDDSYAQYSPSLVLFYLVIKELFAQKEIRAIDFFGPIDDYQASFGKTTRSSFNMTIYNNKIIPKLYYIILLVGRKIQKISSINSLFKRLKKHTIFNRFIDEIYE